MAGLDSILVVLCAECLAVVVGVGGLEAMVQLGGPVAMAGVRWLVIVLD